MKFIRICDALAPADDEAVKWWASFQNGEQVEIEIISQNKRKRTASQNNALWMWLAQLAQTLNEAGLDMRTVLKQHVEIPWSKDSAADFLWRPVQQAMIGTDSTKQAETVDYPAVYRRLGLRGLVNELEKHHCGGEVRKNPAGASTARPAD